jgi:hypothetical protein
MIVAPLLTGPFILVRIQNDSDSGIKDGFSGIYFDFKEYNPYLRKISACSGICLIIQGTTPIILEKFVLRKSSSIDM